MKLWGPEKNGLINEGNWGLNPMIQVAGWWFHFFFIPTWGNDPIWRAYVSNGLVQPPTRWGYKLITVFELITGFPGPILMKGGGVAPRFVCGGFLVSMIGSLLSWESKETHPNFNPLQEI